MRKTWIRGNWIEEGEEEREEREFYLYLGVFTPKEGYLAVYALIDRNGEFKGLRTESVLAFIVRINVSTFGEHDVEILPVTFSPDCLDVVIEDKEDPKFLGAVPQRLYGELESIYMDYGKRIADSIKKGKR